MRFCVFNVAIVLGVIGTFSAQIPGPVGSGNSPKEVVQQLWARATAGDLLTPEGWNGAAGLFVKHSPPPGNTEVRIVSNYWTVSNYSAAQPGSTTGNTAEVDVEYAEAGKLDSALRYMPPAKTPFYKTSLVFHLVLTQTHWSMFKLDGKTITRKEERPGPMEWQIRDQEGSPWTTVNTAIRYVLEMRNKTTDPAIRKNADQTLAKLLKLH